MDKLEFYPKPCYIISKALFYGGFAMSFDYQRDTVVTRAAAMVDEGLRQYMLKVYNYMTLGLLVTAFVSYGLAHSTLAALFFNVQAGTLSGLGWVAVLLPFALVFMMGSAVRTGNAAKALTLFVIFSAAFGVSMTTVFWAYTGLSILRVFLITAGMFLTMSLYGYTTKRDLTKFGSFLMMGLFGIIIAMVVNIFVRSAPLDFVVSVLGVLIFTGLTAFDTFKAREMYSESDSAEMSNAKAIFGALDLYMDFINLFLYMLRFFGDRRN